MRLTRSFFETSTLKVAKNLLGKLIVRKYRDKFLIGKIVEVEAYIGPHDKASHAYAYKPQNLKLKLKILDDNWQKIKKYVDNKNLFYKRILKCQNCKVTNRNLAEYLRGGHVYIYLVYGNYYQFNITSFKEGYPECILVRSLEPILNLKNPRGPGRLCEELKLNKNFWGYDIVNGDILWLESINQDIKEKIIATTRIGIDYAKEWALKKWRFYLKDSHWISRK